MFATNASSPFSSSAFTLVKSNKIPSPTGPTPHTGTTSPTEVSQQLPTPTIFDQDTISSLSSSSSHSNRPYNEYIHSLLGAALENDREDLQELFKNPIFGNRISESYKRDRTSSIKLLNYITENFTDDFSDSDFFELIQDVNLSSYVNSEKDQDTVQNLYRSLFSASQTLAFSKEDLLDLTFNTLSNNRAHLFMEILKHPSFSGVSLDEVFSLIDNLSEGPISIDLQIQFFSVLFQHPAVLSAPKEKLTEYFFRISPIYKASFLAQLISHSSCSQNNLPNLKKLLTYFHKSPRNEALTTRFYEVFFNHPSIKTAHKEDIARLESSLAPDEVIPFMIEKLKLNAFKRSSLVEIKEFIQTFNFFYAQVPCSEKFTMNFLSVLFKLPEISTVTIAELGELLPTLPLHIRPLFLSHTIKIPANAELSLKNLKNRLSNIFCKFHDQSPVSRECASAYFKAMLSHPSASHLTKEELFDELLSQFHGYNRIEFILAILSSNQIAPFTKEDLMPFAQRFLKELARLDGEKSPQRMLFFNAACSQFQKNGYLSEREAKKATHWLVQQVPN